MGSEHGKVLCLHVEQRAYVRIISLFSKLCGTDGGVGSFEAGCVEYCAGGVKCVLGTVHCELVVKGKLNGVVTMIL